MSCEKCETERISTYVRVGNANVEICGCSEHLRELMGTLRLGNKTKDRSELFWILGNLESLADNSTKWSTAEQARDRLEELRDRLKAYLERNNEEE